jgi:hypothetical protein
MRPKRRRRSFMSDFYQKNTSITREVCPTEVKVVKLLEKQ